MRTATQTGDATRQTQNASHPQHVDIIGSQDPQPALDASPIGDMPRPTDPTRRTRHGRHVNHLLRKTSVALAFTTAVMILTAGPAAARSVPANIGVAWNGADAACFQGNGRILGRYPGPGGAIFNTCTTAKSFELPLPIDNSGAKNIQVEVFGTDTTNRVGCQAWGSTRDWYTVSSSPRIYMTSFNSFTYITLNGVNVLWPDGFLYVDCELAPGGGVISASYNQ